MTKPTMLQVSCTLLMFGGQFQIQNPDLTPLIALGMLQFSMTKNPIS